MENDITAQSIRDLRKRYGLSRHAFAQLLGIGEASLARYENGATPSKANANLIRAAAIPEFMRQCLEEAGDSLSSKQRESVEKIIYTEVIFDEEGNIMDMTNIYELTLRQEVLNEKAAEIMGDIINGMLLAEEQHDEASQIVYKDLFSYLADLKPTIASMETLNNRSLDRIDGELDCLKALSLHVKGRAA